MRPSSFALIVGFYVIGIALPFQYANAQPQPGPPSRLGPPGSGSEAAPDWLAWRVFYESLEFYSQQSPTHVQELLVERVGLSVQEADVALAAGRSYLQQLSRLDDSARADIKARFQAGDLGKLPVPQPPTSPPVSDLPPAGLINGAAAGKQSLSDALVADGFVARVTNQRVALFAAHRAALASALGPAKFGSLEQLVRTEVAPKVRVVNPSLERAAR